MKKKKKRYKNKNLALPLFLVFILIILMGYASFLLYSFAKDNGILQPKTNKVDEDSKFSKNSKENKIKLDFLSKIFSKPISDNKDKTDSITDQNTTQDEFKKDQNIEDTNKNDSVNKTSTNNNSDENLSVKNDNTQKIDNTQKVDNNTSKISNLNNTYDKKEKNTYKINSKDFIIYLAALDKEYELYLAKKVEKIDYTDSPIFAVISFLINYKPKDPYLNLIPEGTKLLGAWIKNKVLYLDFNKAFLNNKNGLKSIEIQIYQIVNTAMQFEQISGVRFLIEGNTKKYYSDEGFLLDITFKQKSFDKTE